MNSLNSAFLENATVVWGIASGLAVAIIGGASLFGGRSRPRGAFPFGLFGILWGIQIASINLSVAVPAEVIARRLQGLFLIVTIPTTYLLVAFAASQSASAARRRWSLIRTTAGLVGGLTALTLILAPALIYGGAGQSGATFYPLWGPLYPFVIVAPQFIAFGLALLSLSNAEQGAATPRTSVRAATLLTGLGIYVAYAAGNNLAFFGGRAIENGGGVTWFVTSIFVFLSSVSLYVGVSRLLRARTARGKEDRMRGFLLASALLVPLVIGTAEGVITSRADSPLETVGLWRLAGVGVIAYGLARWRVYDLADRARRVAANAGGTAVAAASGAAAYGAATVASGSPPVAAALAVLGVAAALLPGIRFARRLFGVRPVESEEAREIMYGKRIDSYRAALESSIARGTLDEDETFLAALRNRFQISDAEHRVLLHYARSSVIVARSSHAWEAYERLRLLGEGGGGRTWLARDRARDRLVVLKEPLQRWQVEPGAREAVLREARLAARVRHPNVVHIEEVVEGKGSPVIVMEYLEGGTVRDLVDSRGPLPWSEAAVLVREVLAGVSAIHSAGIIHRDIKPSNILLTGDGVPKIADFGVAVPGSGDDKTQVMGTGTVAGTMSYMAPEVREGAAADRGADLYAVAVVLYECVHGVVPGRGVPAISDSELPPALIAVLARGMAERPDARYPSARAFADDLARLTG